MDAAIITIKYEWYLSRKIKAAIYGSNTFLKQWLIKKDAFSYHNLLKRGVRIAIRPKVNDTANVLCSTHSPTNCIIPLRLSKKSPCHQFFQDRKARLCYTRAIAAENTTNKERLWRSTNPTIIPKQKWYRCH